MANGPTTAVESEYTYVSVATADRLHPGLQHPRSDLTSKRLSPQSDSEPLDTPRAAGDNLTPCLREVPDAPSPHVRPRDEDAAFADP